MTMFDVASGMMGKHAAGTPTAAAMIAPVRRPPRLPVF